MQPLSTLLSVAALRVSLRNKKSLFWFLVLAWKWSACAEPITPPTQPATGPGGADYPYQSVQKSGPYGTGAQSCWIFEPDAPNLPTAPIIVFLHGYGGVNSASCGRWIEHLVKRGNTVIFPIYQASLLDPENYTDAALAGIKEAFRVLRDEPGHRRPDSENRWAILGYSLGCSIGAMIAGRAESEGLPRPKAYLACNAGDTNIRLPFLPPILTSPEAIPDLLMLVIVGDDDSLVGQVVGRKIFEESRQVNPIHKNLIRLYSDSTGQPALKADHFAPVSRNPQLGNGVSFASIARPHLGTGFDALKTLRKSFAAEQSTYALGRCDALDFYGYWKWFDGLTDAAFYGKNCHFALGDTPEQKFMGKWRNGMDVKQPLVELGRAPHSTDCSAR